MAKFTYFLETANAKFAFSLTRQLKIQRHIDKRKKCFAKKVLLIRNCVQSATFKSNLRLLPTNRNLNRIVDWHDQFTRIYHVRLMPQRLTQECELHEVYRVVLEQRRVNDTSDTRRACEY